MEESTIGDIASASPNIIIARPSHGESATLPESVVDVAPAAVDPQTQDQFKASYIEKLKLVSPQQPEKWYDSQANMAYEKYLKRNQPPAANFVQEVTDKPQPEVEFSTSGSVPVIIAEQPNTLNLLIGDNWFTAHPDKVLGETYMRSTRYAKDEPAVRGTLSDAMSRIDAELVDQQGQEVQPLETIITPTVEESLTEDKVINIKRSIKQSKSDYTERIIAEPGNNDLQSFDDILTRYNPGISMDEIQAFAWYKFHIGDPLGGEWSKYMVAESEIEEKLKQWVAAGIVCWHKGDFMPAYLYFAENIYERISELHTDRDIVIEKFGQEQFDKQMAGLEKARMPQLTLTAPVSDNENRRLIILPISKFAQETYISELKDGTVFETHDYRTKTTTPQKLSLVDAFADWIYKYPGSNIKEGTNASEIVEYYLRSRTFPQLTPKEEKLRIKQRTKKEGNRLFAKFLAEELLPEDQAKIEYKWNSTFNGYVDVNYNKVPIAFQCSKFFQKETLFIKPEKREGVAFTFANGSSCIAYDVGVGKTITALFTMAQYIYCGYAKRILVVVPNQTYAQWIQECKGKIVNGEVVYNGVLPQIPINDFYNLGTDYVKRFTADNGEKYVVRNVGWESGSDAMADIMSGKQPAQERVRVFYDDKKKQYYYKDGKKIKYVKDEELISAPQVQMVQAGSITFITYEGMEQIGLSDANARYFTDFIYDIINQGKESDRDGAKLREKVEKSTGQGLKNTLFNIEDFGFDFICFDEAHKMKKSFTQVKGEVKDGGQRGKSQYQLQSGSPSDIAIKGLMLSQYIFHKNNYRNILLLTATPFTNSPLEIYSMLALIGYQRLKREGLNNINEFFNTFVKTSTELVISAKLKPERKETVMGFNNLITLQQLIYRFINYKTGEDVGVERPNKIVLPLVNRRNPVSGQLETLPENQQVNTFLPMTATMKAYMADVENYIRGTAELGEICNTSMFSQAIEEQNEETATEGIALDENRMNDDEKAGVRVLRGLSYAKLLALSPHLYPCSNLGVPTYKEYVEQSPKFSYTMQCIESVKKYHQAHNEPMSGQLIYMNTGIDQFSLLKDYLVYELGFKADEIGIIRSGMSAQAKNRIKDRFNDGLIHVVIGSATIREGINLQKRTTVGYNLYLDWNPTDIKQWEGRFWRFGNEYANVRSVNPLMENSVDSFIFQKLEEKTSRINEIWSRTNKQNDLKLEEFNPTELKMGLITDPYALAELQLLQNRERMQDEIQGVQSEIEVLKNFQEAKTDYNQNIREFDRIVEQYRPARPDKDTGVRDVRKLNTRISLFEDIIKTQRDSNDKYVYLDYSEQNLLRTIKDSMRMINRVERTYLIPRGLNQDVNVGEQIQALEAKITTMQELSEKETGKEAVDMLAKQIIEKRKAMHQRTATVEDRVKEFSRLNNLLSIKKVYAKTEVIIPEVDKKVTRDNSKYTSCPPMTADGKRSVTKEALAYLEHCIASEPQTKNAHTDATGLNYTPKRIALHDKIISQFKEQKPCVQEKPIAVLTGGAPGSGKTRFLKTHARWLLSKDVYHIDADEVRAMLPEYKGWNAPATHEETKDIVNRLITEIGTPCRHDLVYDGTMNKAKNYLPLIDRLKSMGYDVYIIFMQVPKEVSEERVLDRYVRTGRYVPHEVIEEVFDLGSNAFEMLKDKVDGYVQINGVTNEIISEGGMQIPENRNYKLSDGTGPVKELSTEERKQQYSAAIDGYKTLLNLTTDSARKKQLRAAIDGYQTLLELL